MRPASLLRSAALALLLTTAPLVGLHAQDAGGACHAPEAGAPCDGSGPASLGSTSGVDLGAGNPINVVSGNKYQMEVDLPALPGELGLEIVRHYNSASRHVVGQLGMGWRLSYETDLYRVGPSVQVLQADGRRLSFAIDPENPNHCAGSDPAQGWIEILDAGTRHSGYVWHWTHGPHAGRQLRFDASGKLVQIRAASGALLTLRRGPRGELLQVTDPQGRSLIVNHGGELSAQRARREGQAAVFTGIKRIDSPVGRFEYRHGQPPVEGEADADAARGRAQAANLSEVLLPDAGGQRITRRYHYEDSRHRQALTGISVQGTGSDGESIDERIATYAYDEQGRAIISQRGAQQVSLQYLEPALPTREGATLLTNSLGEQTLYRHRVLGGEYRLTEALGAGCAQCGPVNMRWNYDDAGRLIEQLTLSPAVVEAGQVQGEPRPLQGTRHVADGNEVRVERMVYDNRGQARPAELIERQEYADPSWPDKPTRIARASVVPGLEHSMELAYNEAGQLIELTERGYSPIDAAGEHNPTAIARTTSWRYERINGRSVLVEVDGPLANGAQAAPSDSDITRYRWDETGSFITSVTLPGDLATGLAHDAAGRLIRATRDDHLQSHWRYDDRGQVTQLAQTGPGWEAPRVLSVKYDAHGRVTETGRGADADASAEGPMAALLAQAQPYSPLQARGYDTAGRLAWAASSLGMVQALAHDSEGRVTQSGRYSNAMAQVQSWQYGPLGQIAAWRDNAGRYARIEYDSSGRPSAYGDSSGRRLDLASVSSYLPRSGAAAPDAATRSPVQIMRDDLGRTVARSGGAHGRHLLAWNEADQLIAMQDALGNRASYRYDAAGRILQQDVQPAGANERIQTQWHYDGRLLVRVDYPTQSEHYRHDARGLLASRRVTLAAANGQPAISSSTSYLHDAQGRLAASSLPDGSWLHYERNGQGQVTALVRSPVQRPWLRKLAPEQVIASDFQRDLMGLKSYTAGNGVQSLWQRDGAGNLARIVHRAPEGAARLDGLQAGAPIQAPWPRLGSIALERLLGITPAHAQSAAVAAPSDGEGALEQPTLPGALGLPTEHTAFFDERYLWSAGGLLLHSQRPHGNTIQLRSRAYDAAGQLVAAVHARARASGMLAVAGTTDSADEQLWRYAYQGQRRVLAQQATRQSDTQGHTKRTAWSPPGRPILQWGDRPATAYNANGQPTRRGSRRYHWDALGRLQAIEADGKPLARYSYDHRGLRIAKHAGRDSTRYLYSPDRHLLAELDGPGRLQRQYVYLADLLLAVIDTDTALHRIALQGQSQTPALWTELRALGASHLRRFNAARITWVHSNHLGAPEAATDANRQLLWQADYAPFGAASVHSAVPQAGLIQASRRKPGQPFALNVRLPGQYFDAESGLHYNRQRYYDPAAGAYLTPDPLGNPDGPNAYAYVANNPLGHIDPDGLVLFAFDGTQNSDAVDWLEQTGGSLTNVVRFRDAYNRDINGAIRYVTGVGTLHRDALYGDIDAPVLDAAVNRTGVDRIDRMLLYLRDEAMAFEHDEMMQVDIIGFSRGAAQARDFANQVVGESRVIDGRHYYFYDDPKTGNKSCQWVNFRFMGLFDTVLSTNAGRNYNLAIPGQFAFVAHAVALNEYRSQPADFLDLRASNRNFFDRTRVHMPGANHWGGFPLEAMGVKDDVPGETRIELGFVGAHADIGGGYPEGENQLAQVALSWMVGQAQLAGVAMNAARIEIPAGTVVLHDQSNVMRFGDPTSAPETFEVDGFTHGLLGPVTYSTEDRYVRRGFTAGSQRRPVFDLPVQPGGNRSMLNADTHQFITYAPRPDNIDQDTRSTNDIEAIRDLYNRTGTVDMQGYMDWLRNHGYAFAGLESW